MRPNFYPKSIFSVLFFSLLSLLVFANPNDFKLNSEKKGVPSNLSKPPFALIRATALNFDGYDDFVAINNPFRAYGKELTVEFWMYTPDATMPFGSVMGQGTSNVDEWSANNVWLMHPNNDAAGTMSFYVNDAGTPKAATFNILAGGWHHYAGVASASGIKVYVDGVLIQTVPGITGNILNNPNSVIHIGKDVRFDVGKPGDRRRYGNMTIDEVRIWDRALCQDELNARKNCQLIPSSTTGLQEYYQFSQGVVDADNSTVRTLNDISGNNRSGALNNFALTGLTSNWAETGANNANTCATYVQPSVSISGSTNICAGSTTTLTSSLSGGKWSSSNTAVATINETTGVVTAISAGTTTITYKTECAQGSVSFTVKPLPNSTISAGGATTICPGSFVTLSAVDAAGNTYQWFNNGNSINGATNATYNAANSGAYTVRVTNNGCTSTSASPISINAVDVTLPVINGTPTITTPLNADGTVNATSENGAVVNFSLPTATDNCTQNVTVVALPSSGSVFPIGTSEVNITATDASGNSVQSKFYITVTGRAPSIVVPANISVNNDVNTCGATVNFAATETVGVPAATITYSHQPGSVFPIGTTTVTATATNALGSSVKSFTVTVVDNQFPVISNPPSNIVVSCESLPSLTQLNVTDNCSIANSLMYQSLNSNMKAWLVHEYKFENNLGDSKGIANGINNGVTYTNGIIGRALDFDGQAGKYIKLGPGGSLNGIVSFGISVWVKTNSGNPMTVIQQRDANINGQYMLNIGGDHNGGNQYPGKVYFMIYGSNFQFELVSSVRVDDGKWHHIVAERDGVNGRIYVDGSLVASVASSILVPLTSSIGTYIGMDVRDANKNFIGQIDQLKIYSGVSTSNKYDLERTWSYTDAGGNQVMTQQIVTVQDITPPVIGDAIITTPTDANGAVTATSASGAVVNFILPTAMDNCSGIRTVQTSKPSGSIFPIGTTTVTFTSRDAVNNIATKTWTVTVKGIAPSIVVPSTITATSPSNACGSTISFAASETTGIPASTITYSHQPGSLFPVGTTTVTATATNSAGTSSATFNIVIKDLTKPLIGTVANINTVATSAAGAVVNFSLPTVTDNCSGVISVEATPASGSVFPIGTSTVTITARDAGNNVSARPFTVTVTGVTPSIVVPSTITVDAPANACGTAVEFAATETIGIPASTITYSHQPGSVFPVGTTTVTATATNAIGTSVKTFDIIVKDVTAPIIAASTNLNAIATSAAGAVVTYSLPTATDNCSGNVTVVATPASGSTFPIGTTTVTIKATDAAGNESTTNFTVTVVGVPPVIVVPATIHVDASAANCGAAVNFAATETTGIPASTITYTVNGQPVVSGATFPLGTTTVTATATNAVGTSSGTFDIVVTDNTAPVINTPAAQIFCENTAGTYSLQAVNASDNCGIATVSFAITGATTRSGDGYDAGTAFNVGTSTIIYTVTDVNGNISTKTLVVTVNKAPTATITTSNPDAFCNKLTVIGNSTSPITGYAWTYNGNAFAGTQAISLDNTNEDGTYSLLVTDNKGCTSLSAVTYQYSKQNTISNYTILAYKEAELKEYNTVQTGSVGVMSKKGEAEIGKYSSIASPGAFVKAPKIEVKQGANVPVRLVGVASVSLPTMQYNSANTSSLPNYTTNAGATISLSGNFKNLKIRKGSNVVLSGTTFGNIDIEEGSVVRFTSTVINVEHLKVGKGPNNGFTQVRFANNTSVRVSKHVQIEEDCFINPDANQVTFYLGRQSNHDCNKHKNKYGNGHDKDRDDDDDDDHDRGHGDGDQKFEVKGGNTTVIANVYAPTGDIKVKGGEGCHKNHSSTTVRMTGLFIGYEVEGEGRNIIWNNYACGSASPLISTDVLPVYNKTAEPQEVADDLKVTVMPNPSTTYFTLKLASKSELTVNIKVVDAAGRIVDVKAKQPANSTMQIGHSYATGSYFAEFIQGNQRKVIQLIKLK